MITTYRSFAGAAVMGGLLALTAPAAAFDLMFPARCEQPRECFVQQLPDRQPGPGAVDFACGPQTYDDHSGVDVALPSTEAMRRGVLVVAAAKGRVRAVRDGMEDVRQNRPGAPDVSGRECGNGLVLEHEDGWTTQYCHMKRGSLMVLEGDEVVAGAPLGMIGNSGQADFPHLHLALRRDGQKIDPFDGQALDQPCGSTPATSLWRPGEVLLRPGGAVSAGILDRVPEYIEIQDSAPTRDVLPADTQAVVHWAAFFGLHKGDVLASDLKAPNGNVIVEEEHLMTRNRARQFRAVGIRRPAGGWTPGTYTGRTALIRDGRIIDEIETVVRLP